MTAITRHRAALFAIMTAAAACSSRGAAGRVPPSAEFLFAAGDSTYWVRSSSDGMRVRSAPILLTQVDGKFYEVFIAEDGADYDEASFSTSQLWSRELASKDSSLLFSDSTVMKEASLWKKANPTAAPIESDDEDAPTDPRTIVRDEIEIVDVHGPFLTFRQIVDIDVEGRSAHTHAGRRVVVDVRTGKLASLTALFGASEAARIISAGEQSLAQLADSIRKVGDDRAPQARESLNSFHFDSSSFGISDIDRKPAVAFLVPGTSTEGEALAIYLQPIAAEAADWWASVQPTLPEWTRDSTRVRWSRNGYVVAARPSSDGESLALVLSGRSGLREREWPIATVAAPAYQLIALDAPPVTPTVRDALSRAFEASSALDGQLQRAHRIVPRRGARRNARPRITQAKLVLAP